MDAENKNPGQENFDRWLDTALHARADAEPRMGLEDRVLARLATTRPPSKEFSLWPVMIAAAAALVISAALVVTNSFRLNHEIAAGTRSASPAISKAPATQLGSNSTPGTPDNRRVITHRVAKASAPQIRHVEHEESLPRLATFPALSPETEQEHMLARVAARRSSFDLANVSTDLVPLKDLSVPELKIDPMEGTPSDTTPQE